MVLAHYLNGPTVPPPGIETACNRVEEIFAAIPGEMMRQCGAPLISLMLWVEEQHEIMAAVHESCISQPRQDSHPSCRQKLRRPLPRSI